MKINNKSLILIWKILKKNEEITFIQFCSYNLWFLNPICVSYAPNSLSWILDKILSHSSSTYSLPLNFHASPHPHQFTKPMPFFSPSNSFVHLFSLLHPLLLLSPPHSSLHYYSSSVPQIPFINGFSLPYFYCVSLYNF